MLVNARTVWKSKNNPASRTKNTDEPKPGNRSDDLGEECDEKEQEDEH
jgi:hypothetical protein